MSGMGPLEALAKSDFMISRNSKNLKNLIVATYEPKSIPKIGERYSPTYHVFPEKGVLSFSCSPHDPTSKKIYRVCEIITTEDGLFVALCDKTTGKNIFYNIHTKKWNPKKGMPVSKVPIEEYLLKTRED